MELLYKEGKFNFLPEDHKIQPVVNGIDEGNSYYNDKFDYFAKIAETCTETVFFGDNKSPYLSVRYDSENDVFVSFWCFNTTEYDIIFCDNVNDAIEMYLKLSPDIHAKLKYVDIEAPNKVADSIDDVASKVSTLIEYIEAGGMHIADAVKSM